MRGSWHFSCVAPGTVSEIEPRRIGMKTTYGLLVGVIGVGAWWFIRRRQAERTTGERGRVIFRNTPEATALSGDGVI
jgi:hypothetical protein